MMQPCLVEVGCTSNMTEIKAGDESSRTSRTSALKKKHGPIYKVNCIYCGETLDSKRSLVKHMKKNHGDIDTFSCALCSTFFYSSAEKKRHLKTHHKHRCVFCKKGTFVSNLILKQHVYEIHNKELVKCNYNRLCVYYCKSRIELQEHVLKVHETGEGKRKCIYCNKWFINRIIMSRHVKSHHSSVFIKCDHYQCAVYFKSEEKKWKHTIEVHETGDNVSTCVYCRKNFKHRLSIHVRTNHKSEAIKCNFSKKCDTFFLTNDEREKHILDIHKTKKQMEKASCCYCKKILASKVNVLKHINLVHSDVKIKCPIFKCATFFHSQSEREKHFIEKHSESENSKPWKCQQCDYKTTQSIHLKSHQETMHGTENIICPKCPKVFKAHSVLLRHLTNSHIEREKCNHCNLVFGNLRKHQKIDFCKICNKVNLCSVLRKNHTINCKEKSIDILQ